MRLANTNLAYIAIAIVAIGIFLVVVYRGQSPSSEHLFTEGNAPPAELRADTFDYKLEPGNNGLKFVREVLVDKILASSSTLLSDKKQAEHIAKVVAEHLELLLEPSFDRWIDLVQSRSGIIPPKAFNDGEGEVSETYRRNWDFYARGLSGSAIAPDEIKVREVEYNDIHGSDLLQEFSDYLGFPGSMIRKNSDYSGKYITEDELQSASRRVEVLIPVRYRPFVPENESPVPAILVIRLASTSSGDQWKPYDLLVVVVGSRPSMRFDQPVY